MPSYQLETHVQSSTADVSATTDKVELIRQAMLIADGIIPFPCDLGESEIQELWELVRSHRRKRLIQFVARQIAADVRDHRTVNRMEFCDAEEPV